MKRGNKRGQFYIIAAMIIIAVIIGFASISNYAKTKKNPRIYDLGKELGIETGYVYDYGVYNETDINSLINHWSDVYLNYTKDQEVIEKWIFVYGKENELTAMVFFSAETGSVSIGRSEIIVSEIKKKIIEDVMETGGNISIEFQGFSYNFKLEKGENFFFIISSKEYVAGTENE